MSAFWRRFAEVSAILLVKKKLEFYPGLDLEEMR
jgi:hypothetical protein